MEDSQVANLIRRLIKEIRTFSNDKSLREFSINSLAVEDFIKILDLIYCKLSPDVFYSHLVEQGFNLYSLNDYDFIQCVLKVYQSILKQPKILTIE